MFRPHARLLRVTIALAVALGLIFGLGSFVPVSAQDDLTAGVSDRFAGTELRLIMANHPWNTAIQRLIPQFEEASGITLRIESYFEEQLSQKLQIGLTSGASQADAFMFRPLQEGRLFAKNGWVADLKPYAEAEAEWNWADFQEATRSTVSLDEFVFGIPIVTEREMVYYRTDLFEAAGLEAPETMDELLEAAKALHKPDDGVYGICMRGRRAGAVTQFSSFLYSFGGTWMTDDDKSALDTPEAIAAYRFYGDLLRLYGPPGVLNMHWPECMALFQQGKVAMWIDAEVFYANVIDPAQSVVADKVGFAAFPAGSAGAQQYNVTSWAIGMNDASPNKDAAWEFIKWATSVPVVKTLQPLGNPGARASVWNSPEGLEGLPEDYARVVQLQSARGVGTDRPLVIRVGEARDIVGGPIVVAIEGGDVEAAVKEAHAQFDAFLEEDLR